MMLGVMPGTLDVLVLKAVDSGAGHGYGVARWVRETTDGEMEIEEGALYTALHRLEKRGALKSRWQTSETGRRAKFYRPTDEGAAHLATESERWAEFSGAVSLVLGQ